MIYRLVIQNFKLIQDSTLELSSGFNCVTGETGTGKSMLLSAMRALTGEKIDPDFYLNKTKENTEKLDLPQLQLWFNPTNNTKALDWLEDKQFILDKSDAQTLSECYIRRSYSALLITDEQGKEQIQYKSNNFINGVRCTISQIEELSNFIVNIETQGSFSQLIHPATRLELVDQMWSRHDNDQLLQSLETAWQQIQKIQQEVSDADALLQQRADKQQALTWRLEQLEKLDPNVEEFKRIETTVRMANSAQDLLQLLHASDSQINGDNGVFDLLGKVKSQLSKVHEEKKITQELDQLDNAYQNLYELKTGIAAHIDSFDFDEDSLKQMQEKFDAYISCGKALNTTPEELEELHIQSADELAQMDSMAKSSEELQHALQSAKDDYRTCDEQIGKLRREICNTMQHNINAMLPKLAVSGMLGCEVVAGTDGPKGSHKVDFTFDPMALKHMVSDKNEFKPLEKIASGGELSRIFLAVFLSVSDNLLPCLVLDEIDVGIGGETAVHVGNLLADIATSHQLILVTHLATIAAHSEHHLIAQRDEDGLVQFSSLDEDGKQSELKRMLGGKNVPLAVKRAASSLS